MSGRHRRERRQQPVPRSAGQPPPSVFGLDRPASPDHGGEPVGQSQTVGTAAPQQGTASTIHVEELLEALTAVRLQRRELDARQQQLVEALLRAGVGWARLGAALGITRQAAHKRYSAT